LKKAAFGSSSSSSGGGSSGGEEVEEGEEREARDRLSLLLLQEGRVEEADEVLTLQGYTHRLGHMVLSYPIMLPPPSLLCGGGSSSSGNGSQMTPITTKKTR